MYRRLDQRMVARLRVITGENTNYEVCTALLRAAELRSSVAHGKRAFFIGLRLRQLFPLAQVLIVRAHDRVRHRTSSGVGDDAPDLEFGASLELGAVRPTRIGPRLLH